MKNKGVRQSQASSRNSELIDVNQVGVWWRAMISPFRTPQFSFFYNEKYKL